MILVGAHAGDRMLLEAHFAAEAELYARTACANIVGVLDRGIDGSSSIVLPSKSVPATAALRFVT